MKKYLKSLLRWIIWDLGYKIHKINLELTIILLRIRKPFKKKPQYSSIYIDGLGNPMLGEPNKRSSMILGVLNDLGVLFFSTGNKRSCMGYYDECIEKYRYKY